MNSTLETNERHLQGANKAYEESGNRLLQNSKGKKEAKPSRKRNKSVCHHSQMQQVDILVSKRESRMMNTTEWAPTWPKTTTAVTNHIVMPLEDTCFKSVHPKTAIEGRTFSWSSFALSVGRKGKPTWSRTRQLAKRGEAIPTSHKYMLQLNTEHLLKCSWRIKIYTATFHFSLYTRSIQELSVVQSNGKRIQNTESNCGQRQWFKSNPHKVN